MRLAVMILPLAVFVHLQAACAGPMTWSLIKKIAITESGLDTDAVHDNTTGRVISRPRTKRRPRLPAAWWRKAIRSTPA